VVVTAGNFLLKFSNLAQQIFDIIILTNKCTIY